MPVSNRHETELSQNHRNQNDRVRRMVYLAVLTALVVLLQLPACALPIAGTSLSFVLIPVAMAALMLGVGAAAFLGLVSGVVVLLTDPLAIALFSLKPVFTVALCLLKTSAAGAAAAVFYKLFSRRFPRVAVILTCALVPLCNTGIFLAGGCMILDTLGEVLPKFDIAVSPIRFLFGSVLLMNALPELALNTIAGPAVYRALRAAFRHRG